MASLPCHLGPVVRYIIMVVAHGTGNYSPCGNWKTKKERRRSQGLVVLAKAYPQQPTFLSLSPTF
jgi:hypothetical protein